jgi:hypothetical protein
MATFKRTGTLQGTNTLDTVVFTVDLPADISYTVKATGGGNNNLRVRCGQQLIAIWAQIDDFEIGPGQSATRSFHTGIDGTTPTTDGKQDVRIRMSRDLTTKAIDWELTWSVN